MANLNLLTRTGARSKMRVGRGGKRGKTAGRGTKGQNARAGRKKRPEMRDIIKKLPKRRGYGKNRARTVNAQRVRFTPVSLERISSLFDTGAEITIKVLADKGVVKTRGGKLPRVKIVGSTTDKKFVITGISASGTAKAALEKAGGSVK